MPLPVNPRTGVTRTARSRRTRAALVHAVRDELRASGAFTAEAVTARAGCSPATFYSHFGTKDDALAAAFGLVLDELVELTRLTLTVELYQGDGVAPALRLFVDRQADFFRDEMLVFRTALARLPEHRGLREAYRDAEAATLEHLELLVHAGQTLGLVRPGDAEQIAEAIMVLAQGINNPRALRPEAHAVRASLARALTAQLRND